MLIIPVKGRLRSLGWLFQSAKAKVCKTSSQQKKAGYGDTQPIIPVTAGSIK
jgi:hypothetical protein